ncbi:HAD family hydrolase [Arthrobacter crystallopoietes]|jgi:putative hydrolase of the HAD superfamily|uniref:Putative hydrolase of the HAD superfamily n=1 Tax=Crystallibacter crystallopoietes TaxID=37928 RepID=A0A1H1FPL0_9MICC|nr:HAD family phosphatase [Arthrobacter crystallopoietes]AUI52985.1 haloacid dehalogenase [Arthrobacter crystallopoietes]SDR02698.1 putative hydrolase of the HAD superfamily [Arthrobacter crystallopoietes]
MATLTPGPQWYLFDYGMVISTAPEEADWLALEEAAGLNLRQVDSAYWLHRLQYDEGRISSRDYWTRVVGSAVSEGRAMELDSLDAIQWSHLNLDTLDVLDLLSSRTAQLAVLSNMPLAMADEFSSAAWTRYFSQCFYSSRIGKVKPNPGAFQHVLSTLNADPAAIVFIDDKAENIAAAKALGMTTVHHVPGTDLLRELGL